MKMIETSSGPDGPKAVNEFRGPVGSVVTVDSVLGDVNIVEGVSVTTSPFDPEMVARLRAVFVAPTTWAAAQERLRSRQAVALVGPPGTGRRTGAINLLTDTAVRPHDLALDADDVNRRLVGEPGCGYLLDLAALAEAPGRAGPLLDRYLQELRRTSSPLVVLVTGEMARAMDLDLRGLSVDWAAPSAAAVFRRHLAQLGSVAEAEEWLRQPQVAQVVAEASLTDAVRLVGLIQGTARGGRRGPALVGHLDEVLGVYRNWDSELIAWDDEVRPEPDAGERRAVLLALAALEGEPAAVIVGAAERLISIAGLAGNGGKGLTGPGVSDRMSQLTARVSDGRVTFARLAYATAVLDRAWIDRPRLRQPIHRWLASIGGEVSRGAVDGGRSPGRADKARQTLLALARRQQAPSLVLDAVVAWDREEQRPIAVALLTSAAGSEEIGRAVRRRMYGWATSTETKEHLYLLVARVCAGELADVYPAIVLTRLRHLAGLQREQVRQAVVDSISRLAYRTRLRGLVRREVVAWASPESGRAETRAATGRRAFLTLARLTDDAGRPLALTSPLNETELDELGRGWRAVLRAPESRAEGETAISGWLTAAAERRAPQNVVVQTLVRACAGNSVDVALVTGVVWAWSRDDGSDSSARRVEIRDELFDLALPRDGLSPALVDVADRERRTDADVMA
jgi:hypothetical protein